MCRLLGSYLLPFILSWTGYHLGKGLYCPTEPMLLLLWPWAFWPLILPYHFIVFAIALPFFLLLIIPWACGLMFLPYQPISSSIFCSGLPRPTFHVFTSFGLVGQHSYHASSFYHFISWASLTHLLLFYLYYSHRLFAKFFGLPQLIYYIFTSYYPFGLIGH